MTPDGLIPLDKPPGLSSAAAVRHVKRLLPRGTKIGHAGTLDPFATGLLLLLIGKATRRCEMLMGQPKEYLATLKLGATTETLDPESPEQPAPPIDPPPPQQVAAAIQSFVGDIQQIPPVFSALKVRGRPAYDRARRGETLDLPARTVHVDAIHLLEYDWPLLRLRVRCGRGTYIRALARDLGQALNSAAYLTHLRRTRIGPYAIGSALTLPRLIEEGVRAHVIPLA